MLTFKANGVPVHRWQQKRFAAPEMEYGDYAKPPGKVTGRFTAGAEA
jgi:hypothetical protein